MLKNFNRSINGRWLSFASDKTRLLKASQLKLAVGKSFVLGHIIILAFLFVFVLVPAGYQKLLQRHLPYVRRVLFPR